MRNERNLTEMGSNIYHRCMETEAPSKRLPMAQGDTSSLPDRLTPSEIESLRQECREARRKFREYDAKKAGRPPAPQAR